MRKILPILILLLSGCTATKFQIAGYPESSGEHTNIELIDKRNKLSVVGGKNSILDTYFYHADENIIPSKLSLLKAAVSKRFSNKETIKLEVYKFDVIDHYPKRMGAGQSAGLASIGIYTPSNSSGNDFITCIIEVRINGKLYRSSHSMEYIISEGKMLVTEETSYKNAVQESISTSLNKLFN